MSPQTLDPQRADLEAFIEAYETAQAKGGDVNFVDFLPTPNHPDYLHIICELVRLDLEYGWHHHRPKDLRHYQEFFPILFCDADCLRSIAYEEFRQRRRAG